jgi:hypothetical protein
MALVGRSCRTRPKLTELPKVVNQEQLTDCVSVLCYADNVKVHTSSVRVRESLLWTEDSTLKIASYDSCPHVASKDNPVCHCN